MFMPAMSIAVAEDPRSLTHATALAASPSWKMSGAKSRNANRRSPITSESYTGQSNCVGARLTNRKSLIHGHPLITGHSASILLRHRVSSLVKTVVRDSTARRGRTTHDAESRCVRRRSPLPVPVRARHRRRHAPDRPAK